MVCRWHGMAIVASGEVCPAGSATRKISAVAVADVCSSPTTVQRPAGADFAWRWRDFEGLGFAPIHAYSKWGESRGGRGGESPVTSRYARRRCQRGPPTSGSRPRGCHPRYPPCQRRKPPHRRAEKRRRRTPRKCPTPLAGRSRSQPAVPGSQRTVSSCTTIPVARKHAPHNPRWNRWEKQETASSAVARGASANAPRIRECHHLTQGIPWVCRLPAPHHPRQRVRALTLPPPERRFRDPGQTAASGAPAEHPRGTKARRRGARGFSRLCPSTGGGGARGREKRATGLTITPACPVVSTEWIIIRKPGSPRDLVCKIFIQPRVVPVLTVSRTVS